MSARPRVVRFGMPAPPIHRRSIVARIMDRSRFTHIAMAGSALGQRRPGSARPAHQAAGYRSPVNER
jgi:hypothetical protein